MDALAEYGGSSSESESEASAAPAQVEKAPGGGEPAEPAEQAAAAAAAAPDAGRAKPQPQPRCRELDLLDQRLPERPTGPVDEGILAACRSLQSAGESLAARIRRETLRRNPYADDEDRGSDGGGAADAWGPLPWEEGDEAERIIEREEHHERAHGVCEEGPSSAARIGRTDGAPEGRAAAREGGAPAEEIDGGPMDGPRETAGVEERARRAREAAKRIAARIGSELPPAKRPR